MPKFHHPSLHRLGRLPRRDDPRTLRLGDYLPVGLPAAPPSVQRSSAVADWGMMLNDTEGDCTCAGWGHLVLLRSILQGSPQLLTDDQIQAIYVAVTGLEGAAYDPATGVNDNGCVELDVLNYLRKGGRLGAYAAVDPLNLEHIRFTIDAFEGVYMGVAMPVTAQNQALWDVTDPSLGGDAAPGSWGGHCMVAVDYTPDTITFVTWGELKKATWAWWNAYVSPAVGGEAYAILSSDLVAGSRPAPSGFDLPTLQADLAALEAQQVTKPTTTNSLLTTDEII